MDYQATYDAIRSLGIDFHVSEACRIVREESTLPHVLMRPRIAIDGNKWCALYGDNLQDGVAGFGDSPSEAMADFDKHWWAKLPTQLNARRE